MGIAGNILNKIKERIGVKTKTKTPSTPVESITAVINFINRFAYVSGIEFISDWKWNYRLMVTAFANLLHFGSEIYTILLIFPDIKVVIVLGGVSYTTSTSTKFGFIITNQKKFMSLLNTIFIVYKKNVSGNSEQILIGTCQTISKHCRYVLFGILSGMTLYLLYPFYDIIFNGKKTPISPLKFLFIDDQTYVGLFFSTVVNIFLAAQNLCGTFALNCLFLAYVDVYDGFVSLIEADLAAFDCMWEGKDQQSPHKRKFTFRNIMIKLMDLARYNAYMNELFSVIASVQVTASFFGIVFVLFGYLADGYVGGVGAGIYMFTELAMLCYIGQLMENSSLRLQMVVYKAEWYRYDINYQKDILLVLPIFQNVKPILIANVYPLNFETGLKVVKSIYSILMFLMNALD